MQLDKSAERSFRFLGLHNIQTGFITTTTTTFKPKQQDIGSSSSEETPNGLKDTLPQPQVLLASFIPVHKYTCVCTHMVSTPVNRQYRSLKDLFFSHEMSGTNPISPDTQNFPYLGSPLEAFNTDLWATSADSCKCLGAVSLLGAPPPSLFLGWALSEYPQ